MSGRWEVITKLVKVLKTSLDNGEPSLLFDDLACKLFGIKEPREDDLDVLYSVLRSARKRLQREGIVTVLVTEYYFTYGEPDNARDARLCCACGGYSATGIRIATIKGKKDDLIFAEHQRFYAAVGRGFIRENLDRLAIEFSKRKLSLPAARALLHAATSGDEPTHLAQFQKLLKAVNDK